MTYVRYNIGTNQVLASLLGARTLLGAPGRTTRSKKLPVTRASLPATRSDRTLMNVFAQ